MRDLEDARDKTLMGSPGSLIVFEPLLRSTAIHEAGHATAAHHLLRSHDVHSASVRPQGRALGRVIMVPRHDEELVTYYDILAHIAVMLAGRAAEVLEGALLESSPGAEDDLKQASELAYAAVTKWGFGSRTGPHSVVCQDGDISEFLLNRIDADVAGILDYCMRLATNCLKEHRSFHRALAERLERDHSLRLSDLEGIEQQLSA